MNDGYRSEDLAARERIVQLEAELREEDARLAGMQVPAVDPRNYPMLARRRRSLGSVWGWAALPAIAAAVATFLESSSFLQAMIVFEVVYASIMGIVIAFRPYFQRSPEIDGVAARVSERARWAEQAETEAEERAAAIEAQRKKRDDLRKEIDDAQMLVRPRP